MPNPLKCSTAEDTAIFSATKMDNDANRISQKAAERNASACVMDDGFLNTPPFLGSDAPSEDATCATAASCRSDTGSPSGL